MSLLSEAMKNMTILDKIRRPDGEGGFIEEWQDGAPFKAAITFDNSLNARKAFKDGVTSVYTVTTEKKITLQFHDVFRREEDGKIFRVTSDGDDFFTPKSAALNMRQVTAEEWRI